MRSMQKSNVVIIGNGCAAFEACRGLRESGFNGDIRVFASGSLPSYNPMLTSYYAAGKIPYDLLFPYGADNSVFDKYNATVQASSPISTLNAPEKTVTTASGEVWSFDQCLIASGAAAFVPPFPGADSPRVFTMRTVEDAVAVKKAMENKPKRAVVVGASMVGIKLVELFWKAGVEVVLADMCERIFPLAAHPECSKRIEQRLVDMGVRLRFGAAISKAEDTENGITAHFGDGLPPEEADLLLMCIGVRANLGFVNREEINAAQGVLVNSRMQSSVPYIYAAGDAAQGMNILSGQQQVIGLWANARCQGYTAGCNMAGTSRDYAGEMLHNITHFMGMDFVGLGETASYDRFEMMEKGQNFAQIFYKDDKICGANFLDIFTEAGVFKHAIIKEALRGQAEVSSGITPPIHKMLLQKLLDEIKQA